MNNPHQLLTNVYLLEVFADMLDSGWEPAQEECVRFARDFNGFTVEISEHDPFTPKGIDVMINSYITLPFNPYTHVIVIKEYVLLH